MKKEEMSKLKKKRKKKEKNIFTNFCQHNLISRIISVKQICFMVLRNIIPSVMAQIDFVKDLLQVALLTLAVGGPSYVLGNASSFSSVVRKDT